MHHLHTAYEALGHHAPEAINRGRRAVQGCALLARFLPDKAPLLIELLSTRSTLSCRLACVAQDLGGGAAAYPYDGSAFPCRDFTLLLDHFKVAAQHR